MLLDNNSASNLLKYLSIDMIQKALSGHPGAPLGLADVMTILWRNHLKFDPNNPRWVNRDRFILSNGHASALLYATLHLCGYKISKRDLNSFRQLHSVTAGHPEYNLDYGIEMTTGPLGQGFASAVGMAISEQELAKKWDAIDYKTFVMVGDGCLMEGISHEAANIASSKNLDKLIVIWDNNNITIDGHVTMVSKENTLKRFEAYGWEIIGDFNGHNFTEIDEAFNMINNRNGKPKFISFRTIIGKGVKNLEGSSKMHGAPLTQEAWQELQKNLNVDFNTPKKWYKNKKLYTKWLDQIKMTLTDNEIFDLENDITNKNIILNFLELNYDSMSTRAASHEFIKKACAKIPYLFGGSADLDSSVLTKPLDNSRSPYINYGVREFAMCAIANGLSLSGYIPYVGTFLVFSDYAKNAIRLSALMKLPVIYIFTHDSIALGEDGPTHQPVEQLISLRSVPNVDLWRPCDTYETYSAWKEALSKRDGPSILVLSRQKLDLCHNSLPDISEGFVMIQKHDQPDLICLATGSEVSLVLQSIKNIDAKITIISCVNLNKIYKSEVYKTWQKTAPIFVVEAASSLSWAGIQEDKEYRLTLDVFGESANEKDVMSHFGFSSENLSNRIKKILKI